MSGKYTRKNYDECAFVQQTKQSTDQLELVMDINKYVNKNNMCKPIGNRPTDSMARVDIESAIWGLDRLASNCDTAKYPFCGPNGCMLPEDPRIAPNMPPYACDWGRPGENAVINTNLRMPTNVGYRVPDTTVNNAQGNGYYI